MQEFKYSFLAKIIYKYSIVPINIILIFYLLISTIGAFTNWKFVFPLIINIILLYVINRFYFKIYKYFPFHIKADNEKLVLNNFILSKREIEIKHQDVVEIKGAIFSGRSYSPLFLKTNKELIGISPHIKNFNKLLTTILANIPADLYKSLLEDVKKNVIVSKKENNKR